MCEGGWRWVIILQLIIVVHETTLCAYYQCWEFNLFVLRNGRCWSHIYIQSMSHTRCSLISLFCCIFFLLIKKITFKDYFISSSSFICPFTASFANIYLGISILELKYFLLSYFRFIRDLVSYKSFINTKVDQEVIWTCIRQIRLFFQLYGAEIDVALPLPLLLLCTAVSFLLLCFVRKPLDFFETKYKNTVNPQY